MTPDRHYDIVILGAGLAGLTLARHLLLETDKRVLVLERRAAVPPPRQKVGESTVQLAGYYFSKVLDLEEHLLSEHFMKYNLRFYWPRPGEDDSRFEGYTQGYIRELSNIASYQLDRNVFEEQLLRLNSQSPRFQSLMGVSKLDVSLADASAGDKLGHIVHIVRFSRGEEHRTVFADWVVDATGRGKALARRLDLRRPNSIRHGAFFWWVEGLVDIEKLTDSSRREIRLRPERRELGHLPTWLATNHFMGEGLWFWVIPLQGKTSLGLVYDPEVVPHEEVFSVEKATRWVCRRFPLFARDLPRRKVLDFGGFRDFSYDCARTLSADRWAITGEAGRFSDPLYSPGSDLIAVHNTLIVDAIRTGDQSELAAKCASYEQLMRAVYSAYEPSYATSYDALGDAETFALKYAWELTVYFAYYCFPFLNDLFTERRFLPAYLRSFSRLGPINAGVQRLLSGYFRWKMDRSKQGHGPICKSPACFDFTDLPALARARECFYCVGISPEEARGVLTEQLTNLEELARFMAAWVASVVLEEPAALTHRLFVEDLDPERLEFDPAELRRCWAECEGVSDDLYPWSFDPSVLDSFRSSPPPEDLAVGASTSRPQATLQEVEA